VALPSETVKPAGLAKVFDAPQIKTSFTAIPAFLRLALFEFMGF
jgi:hypothetical protein